MQVSADIYNNYFYEPHYEELAAFHRVFTDPNTKNTSLVTEIKGGWTLKAYDNFPKAIIKGETYGSIGDYIGNVADKSRSFDTKQELLTYLKMSINPCDGSMLKVDQGVNLNPSMKFTFNKLGAQANHVPILFARFPTRCNDNTVLTAYEGIYDFRTRLFHGQIQLKDVRTMERLVLYIARVVDGIVEVEQDGVFKPADDIIINGQGASDSSGYVVMGEAIALYLTNTQPNAQEIIDKAIAAVTETIAIANQMVVKVPSSPAVKLDAVAAANLETIKTELEAIKLI